MGEAGRRRHPAAAATVREVAQRAPAALLVAAVWGGCRREFRALGPGRSARGANTSESGSCLSRPPPALSHRFHGSLHRSLRRTGRASSSGCRTLTRRPARITCGRCLLPTRAPRARPVSCLPRASAYSADRACTERSTHFCGASVSRMSRPPHAPTSVAKLPRSSTSIRLRHLRSLRRPLPRRRRRQHVHPAPPSSLLLLSAPRGRPSRTRSSRSWCYRPYSRPWPQLWLRHSLQRGEPFSVTEDIRRQQERVRHSLVRACAEGGNAPLTVECERREGSTSRHPPVSAAHNIVPKVRAEAGGRV